MQHLTSWGLGCADATKFAMSDVVLIDVDVNQELMKKHLGLGQAERPATPKIMNYEASKADSRGDDHDGKRPTLVQIDPIAQHTTMAFKFSGHTQKFLAIKHATNQDKGWIEILFQTRTILKHLAPLAGYGHACGKCRTTPSSRLCCQEALF